MHNKFHPYGYTLSNNPNIAVPAWGVKIRKAINPLILKTVKMINKTPLQLECDNRKKNNNNPKIYIATHAFAEDVLNSCLAINEPCYILAGNMEVFFHSFNGFATWLYGGIVFDRMDNNSRKSASLKMERVLKLGTSILLFPEGAWNMSLNKPLADFHGGFYDLALKTGCEVVPIVTYMSRDNKCLGYVGKEIDIKNIDLNTLNEIYHFISKCLKKCLDFPIYGYPSYYELCFLLNEYANKVFTLLQDNEDIIKMEENILKIKNETIAILKKMTIIKDRVQNTDEEFIVKRIEVYLKAIVVARKRVVIAKIRDDMVKEKYYFMEKYGSIRRKNNNLSLEEIVQIEKKDMIRKVNHYDYVEEQKSLFLDPLKKDMEDPLVKIKSR